MTKQTPERARRTVAKWAVDARSATAQLGARLMAGDTLTTADAEALGVGGTNILHAVQTLEVAGYMVERARVGGNARSVRVTEAPKDAPTVAPVALEGGTRRNVRAEVEGATHPALGAKLTVRALALDERGRLVVHLSNGTGGAWAASILGHVAQ